MSPITEVKAGRMLPKILGLVALSAMFAGAVAFAMHGVRDWPLRASSFFEVAGFIWAALVILGIGGAWWTSRAPANSSSRA